MYVLQNGYEDDDDDDVSERTIVKFMDKLYGERFCNNGRDLKTFREATLSLTVSRSLSISWRK